MSQVLTMPVKKESAAFIYEFNVYSIQQNRLLLKQLSDGRPTTLPFVKQAVAT